MRARRSNYRRVNDADVEDMYKDILKRLELVNLDGPLYTNTSGLSNLPPTHSHYNFTVSLPELGEVTLEMVNQLTTSVAIVRSKDVAKWERNHEVRITKNTVLDNKKLLTIAAEYLVSKARYFNLY